MTSLIRTAVIGASWWAEMAQLPGLCARPDVEPAALCARTLPHLEQLAAKFGFARTFTDYRQMLAEVRPEAVMILTPNNTHLEMTLAALEAGAHVICEKPLALNATEAARMLERAEQLKRRHMTFFTYRGFPGARYIKQLIAEGYLGRLYHVQAAYLQGYANDPQRVVGWRASQAESGAGVLADLGVHVIDLWQWWLGPITRVAASLATVIPLRPGADGRPQTVTNDDTAAFTAEFAAGGQATVQLSRVAANRVNYQRFELYGSDGALVYEYDQPLAFAGRVSGARAGEGEHRPIPIPAHILGDCIGQDAFPAVFRVLTDPFFAAAHAPDFTGPSPAPSFADGLAAQKVVDAAIRSAAGGHWETV